MVINHLQVLKLTATATENGCLEYDRFLLEWLIFRCELLLRSALFPNSSFEFSGILYVGPTKSSTFSPGFSLRVAMVSFRDV